MYINSKEKMQFAINKKNNILLTIRNVCVTGGPISCKDKEAHWLILCSLAYFHRRSQFSPSLIYNLKKKTCEEVYFPTLSVYHVGNNKDIGTIPQLHYIKMEICYDPCFIDISVTVAA